MSKIFLDILEIFLNIYGYTYLRLDGSTKIEMRQILTERFNNDKRIFIFILSTRSGGLGINLTGADTVIFYDSDWNPAMDQQAQDRSHRIGQTREVHIYRLISEHTIEENILKKANQKRILDDVVTKEGCFTTEFFKQLDIRDLIADKPSIHPDKLQVTQQDWEKAVTSAEDENDVIAMQKAKYEQAIEYEEFDEDTTIINPSINEKQLKTNLAEDDIMSDIKIETKTDAAENLLTPIYRYAIKFLEVLNPLDMSKYELLDNEVEFEQQDWELESIQKLKDEEEVKNDQDDEVLFYEVVK